MDGDGRVGKDCPGALSPQIRGVRRKQEKGNKAPRCQEPQRAHAGPNDPIAPGTVLDMILRTTAEAATSGQMKASARGDPIEPDTDHRPSHRGREPTKAKQGVQHLCTTPAPDVGPAKRKRTWWSRAGVAETGAGPPKSASPKNTRRKRYVLSFFTTCAETSCLTHTFAFKHRRYRHSCCPAKCARLRKRPAAPTNER